MATDSTAAEAAELARAAVTLSLNDETAELAELIHRLVFVESDAELLSYLLLEYPAIVVELAMYLGGALEEAPAEILRKLWLRHFKHDQS